MTSNSKKHVTRADIVWSYLSVIANTGINVLILPVILIKLPQNELGLWYVFLSFGAFVGIFEGSVNAILIRNVGYVWSGAQDIQRKGYTPVDGTAEPNMPLLWSIISSIRMFFAVFAIVILFLYATLGTYCIHTISNNIALNTWLTAWAIYVLGTAINLYYVYWWPLLLGINMIKEVNKSNMAAKFVQLLLSYIGMFFGLGLVALAIAYLVSGIIGRLCNKYYFYKNVTFNDVDKYNKYSFRYVFNAMAHNTILYMLSITGNYLVTSLTTLIVSSFFGLKVTAQYGLSLQILNFLSSFAMTPYNAAFPSINMARIRKDYVYIKSQIKKTVLFFGGFYVLISAFVILFGNYTISMFSKQQLLPRTSLSILVVIILFDAIIGCFTRYLSTSNELVYVPAILITALLIVSLSLIAVKFFSMGIIALLVIRLLFMLAYNAWKWPSAVLKELRAI